jgi:hypothetical protein
MTDAYRPYAPLGVLKPFAPDVWIVDGPEIRFDLAFLHIPFPTRMTVVRLPSGAVWLHSPIPADDSLVEQVAAIGPVAHLVAPNSIHYSWIGAWRARFPEAQVWAVSRLDGGAAAQMPPHRTLGQAPPPEWEDAIDQLVVEGSRVFEADFLHRPSRTLILTDLIENFEKERFRSRFYRWLARLGGVIHPDGKTPIDLRRTFPRAALKAAVERMIAWAPDRIIVAHGRCYPDAAVAELRRAFRAVR